MQISKFRNRTKFILKLILFSLAFIVFWNYFTDWYLSKIKDPILTYNLNLEAFSGEDEVSEIIAKKLATELGNQIIIASPQRISPFSIAQIYFDLPRKNWVWLEYFKFNFDLINYMFRRLNDTPPYGGFILFDYNVGNYSLKQYKNYIAYLKKIYRIKIQITFSEKDKSPMNIVIYPWIVADCNVSLSKNSYCRNFRLKEMVKNIELEKLYSELGLNSPLSPSIDMLEFKKCSEADPVLQNIVKSMYSHNQLPVLKHFLYNSKKIDVHDGNYRDFRNLNEIKRDAHCYKVIDALGIPYAIMPSHFYLNEIDDQNINTRSKKFQSFIRENFKNAYTISDEISMKGYSANENFSKRVSTNSSDMLLVHGGTIKFWKRKQILDGVKEIDREIIIEKIKRTLELKKFYGLVEFSH